MDMQWKLPSWNMVWTEKIFGEAMKCFEIGKNTIGESTLLSRP